MRIALALCLAIFTVVFAGLSVPCDGSAAKPVVGAISGRSIVVNGKTINVPPVKVRVVIDEPVVFSPDFFGQQLGLLRQCQANRLMRMGIAGVLVPGSTVVKSAAGAAGKVLIPNRDYTLSVDTGALRIPPGSAIKANGTVYASYRVEQRRADSLVENGKGAVTLITGSTVGWSPTPPAAAKGDRVLGAIYSSSKIGALTNADYFPVLNGPYDAHAEAASNAPLLRRTIEQLRSGKPLKIVFWGDSITLGSGSSSDDKCFSSRVVKGLRTRYPAAKIAYTKSAVQGGTTGLRLPTFEKDVIAEKPDLVIVEYVNDMVAPGRATERNFHEVINRIRAAGSELLICIPNVPGPALIPVHGKNNSGSAHYIEFLHKLHGPPDSVATVDIAARCEHLKQEGINPETFTVDGIHPGDFGHKAYADQILATLGGGAAQ
jgi:lysophospholipase L1-like esterase